MTAEIPMKLPYRVFDISTGYVESASIGSVTFFHNTGFETVLEGLYDLGLSIQKSIEEMHTWHNRQVQERIAQKRFWDCCEATLAANASRVFCAKCIMPIREDNSVVTSEMIMDEINQMMRSTNDEYGYDLIQCLEKFGWAPYDNMHVQYSRHFRVCVESYKWSPNLLSPRHNRRSAVEWKIFDCVAVSNDYIHHPGYDIDAKDGLVEEEDE